MFCVRLTVFLNSIFKVRLFDDNNPFYLFRVSGLIKYNTRFDGTFVNMAFGYLTHAPIQAQSMFCTFHAHLFCACICICAKSFVSDRFSTLVVFSFCFVGVVDLRGQFICISRNPSRNEINMEILMVAIKASALDCHLYWLLVVNQWSASIYLEQVDFYANTEQTLQVSAREGERPLNLITIRSFWCVLTWLKLIEWTATYFGMYSNWYITDWGGNKCV